MSKKMQILFRKNIRNTMLDICAIIKEDTDFRTVYEVDTKAGILRMSTHNDDKGDLFSLFTRFEEPGKACAVLSSRKMDGARLNPFSGKWNFHYGCQLTLLQSFETDIKNIL